MKIRLARQSDYKQLVLLYNGFAGENKYSKKGNDSFDKVIKSGVNFIFVAEEEKALIGFISFSIRNVFRYPKPVVEVDELYVVPEYRKRGIGKKLIIEVIKKAKKLKCCKIYIESNYKWKTAHKFYESLGLKNDGYYFKKNL